MRASTPVTSMAGVNRSRHRAGVGIYTDYALDNLAVLLAGNDLLSVAASSKKVWKRAEGHQKEREREELIREARKDLDRFQLTEFAEMV